MEDIKIAVAQNISELRKQNKLTQSELAEKLNYTDKAVSKWERGESVPDVAVLKNIADLFGVTVDYLITTEHNISDSDLQVVPESIQKITKRNRAFLTAMCITLVWFIATSIYTILDSTIPNVQNHFLCFIYAVPISTILWLILNTIWFNVRLNFLIISFLVWSTIGSLYFTLLIYDINIWLLFVVCSIAQVIIFLWSRIKSKKRK